jgi:putative endonuclease
VINFLKSFTTYIVQCSDGTLYTGSTHNLEHRLLQHNGQLKGGAKYTATRRPVTVLYCEVFPTHQQAAAREAQIKRLTRAQKYQLLEKTQLSGNI